MTAVNGNPGQKTQTGDGLQTRIANAKMVMSDTGTNINALDYTTNLVSRYPFAGNGNDSVGANNLTATGAPTYVDGVYGQAVSLNGTTQYLQAANNTIHDQTTNSFAISAWIYVNSTASNHVIAAKRADGATNAGYKFLVLSGGKLYAEHCDGSAAFLSVTGATTLSTATWYFVTATWNRGGNLTLYLNGVSDGSVAISTQAASITNTQVFSVGVAPALVDFFSGNIDQLQVFNAGPPSSTNILQIYNNCHGGMLVDCTVTGSGFTSNHTYRRNVENTAWGELVDLDNAQTITASKTFSGTTNFTGIPLLSNALLMEWKDSGGTARQVFTLFSDNHLYIDNDAAGQVILRTDNGSGAGGNQVTRITLSNGAAQGAAGITYYEPLSSGHVDAGLVNPLMHLYGRRIYQLANASELTNYNNGAGTTGTNALFKGAQLITSASSGNYQGYDWGGTSNDNILTRRDRKFELWFTVSFDSITSVGYEWGLVTSSGRTTLDTTAAGMSIKFDSAASANFIVRNADGVTQTSTTSSVAAAANTTYYIGIINNETNLKFYINGALIATSTTNLPTATTPLMGKIFNITNSAATKSSYTRAVLFTDDQT